ncbi:MAG: DUF4198 domain-containing protein [Sphingomicrobium sp.]
MKFGFAASTILLIATPVLAHDVWIQPQRFQVAPGNPLAVTFQIGHGALRQRWGDDIRRIPLLSDFANGTRRDIRGDLRNDGATRLVTRFATPGLHVIGMQSSFALSDLPAVRFNDYAKAEGLAVVLAARQRAGTVNANGRERYSRRAKALIQVGPQNAAANAMATRPLGLKLEIVPERSPYALGPSRMLPVRVRYNGRPLRGATVKLTSLEFDAKPIAIRATDQQGRATFNVPAVGDWLVNVIWSVPVTGDPNADFDTTFSSLTFGYDPASRPR